jgi:hypothetical protein
MQRPYKVRFNLGRGRNYMKWKVEGPEGVVYYNPADVQIIMHNCQLKNQRKTAEKINEGANKTVCAWVRCERLFSRTQDFLQLDAYVDSTQLKYNPRRLPYWYINEGVNVDNQTCDLIVTIDYKLFTDKSLPEAK